MTEELRDGVARLRVGLQPGDPGYVTERAHADSSYPSIVTYLADTSTQKSGHHGFLALQIWLNLLPFVTTQLLLLLFACM